MRKVNETTRELAKQKMEELKTSIKEEKYS